MIFPPPKQRPVIRARKRDDGQRLVEAHDGKRWREIAVVRTIEEVIAIIVDERGETLDLGAPPVAA